MYTRLLSSNRNYYYDHSGRLVSEKFSERYENGTIDNTEITYLYDESSMIGLVFNRNGSEGVYYYHRNLQGDVIGIYDTNGTKVVEYACDAYGNCTIKQGASNSLSTSDQYGQRITMGIRVGGEVLKTVWMLLADGIRLITPFSGFGK